MFHVLLEVQISYDEIQISGQISLKYKINANMLVRDLINQYYHLGG